MTETCRRCHGSSSVLHKRGHHVAVWCERCRDWCQPGQWIPHVVLVARGVDLTTITEAPAAPTVADHPSLFDAA